jgi:hypothetical protein
MIVGAILVVACANAAAAAAPPVRVTTAGRPVRVTTAGRPVRVTISARPAPRTGTTTPAPRIARDFIGVSMDWCSVGTYTAGDGIAVLAHLLHALDPSRPDIRIGGDGTDAVCHGAHAPGVTRKEAAEVSALARAVDARLILGINLESHSMRLARHQSLLLAQALGRRAARHLVQAIEIGNEPDRYQRYGNHLAQPELGPYFNRFLSDFATWARIARRAFGDPRLPVAGPSLGRYGLPWISRADRGNFSRFIENPGRPGLVTFHSYPLLGSAKCPSLLCGSVPDLLLEHATAGLAARVARYVGRARGLPVRVDEMNSVTQGGRSGVSNTFASALWAADALFEFARAGVVGVNLHTFSAARYALFSHVGGQAWTIHPEYYGLLLFADGAPAGARLLQVSPSAIGPANGPDVKVWATRGPNRLTRITVINKDDKDHTLVLGGAGMPATPTITARRLTAPSAAYGLTCPGALSRTSLCASGDILLGGQTFGRPAGGLGGDVTSSGLLGAMSPGTCVDAAACIPQPPYAPDRTLTVPVPAGSAIVLTGMTPPPRAHNR